MFLSSASRRNGLATFLQPIPLHSPIEPYRVLFIDWHGTLSTSLFWGQWSAPHHPNHALLAAIQRLWVSDDVLCPLLIPWMRGEFTSEHFVMVVARHLEIDYRELLDAFIVGCQQMHLVSGEIIDLVQAIRQIGTQVFIATDNMDSFTRWTVPALNLTGHNGTFDGVLNSHDLRCLKGDRDEQGKSRFFDTFLFANGIDAGDCLLIDDSTALAEIVPGFGMAYARINSKEELLCILRVLSEKDTQDG